MKYPVIIIFSIICICLFKIYGIAYAGVIGPCQKCHSMHDSQGGPAGPVNGASPAGGGAQNTQISEVTSAAMPHLIKSDCLGCHSSTTNETIVDNGGIKIPIVDNDSNPGGGTLAGGNFYYVAKFGEQYGHNIFSKSRMAYAPGLGGTPVLDALRTGAGNCSNSCHVTLYRPTVSVNGTSYTISGCQGCHLYTFHHQPKGPYNASDPMKVNPTYRFLTGHNYPNGNYVEGIEDPNYEQNGGTPGSHNVYMANGSLAPGIINASNHSISSFCAACHGLFHISTSARGFSGNIWIRHPVDTLVGKLVSDGEESTYYTGTGGEGTYDPAIPVAYDIDQADLYSDNVNIAARYSKVDGTHGKVTCLSCHRAHGSPYPAMLRFDYSKMIAGANSSNPGTGCFACHTDKALD